MMHSLIELLVTFALDLIRRFEYVGIFITMALDAAGVPIPSEVVLPFSGFLAASGELNLWLVVIVATIANVVGTIAFYYLGIYGGHPFLEKYGKYFLIHRQDVIKLSDWLARHESAALFFSRMIPGLRTYGGLIIGAIRAVSMSKLIIYTTLGSLVWNFVFAYLGFVAGEKWDFLEPYFEKAEIAIVLVTVAGLIWYIYRHIKKKNI